MAQQLQMSSCPVLEARFSVLKQRIVRPENKEKVIQSYARLLEVWKSEVDLIKNAGPSYIPEINFDDILKNGGSLPDGFAAMVRERGCAVIRNVVPVDVAEAWEAELKEYTKKHRSVGGYPENNPQSWSLWWTKPQVEIRSHSRVLQAMKSIGGLWHVNDPTIPIDFDSQIVYPDRFRIRFPSKDEEYTLNAHLDSGGIERWEDDNYRSCYETIFEGRWEEYDAWLADSRPNARSDLYSNGSACSCWRSLQAWISLSHSNTGEGTLKLLPSLKASTAYIMLRPFFMNGDFDDITATFPGSSPGNLQFYPTPELHPHLGLEKSVIGIPPVRPGDFVFWHCDLVHEVDKYNPGKNDNTVVYYPTCPLTPYNIDSLEDTKKSFLEKRRPRDFSGLSYCYEDEAQHEDNGARMGNILSLEGERAMGFKKFDVEEPGISEGQRKVRQMANIGLGLV